MKMIEVKTAELVAAALDWAVAWAEGDKVSVEDGYVVVAEFNEHHGDFFNVCYSPSVDWAQGGPLIENYKLAISVLPQNPNVWCTDFPCDESKKVCFGATALSAAMRAIVAAKLGDTVSVPAELLTSS